MGVEYQVERGGLGSRSGGVSPSAEWYDDMVSCLRGWLGWSSKGQSSKLLGRTTTPLFD